MKGNLIIKIKKMSATGFFCKVPYINMNFLMTNYHVINEDYTKKNKEIQILLSIFPKDVSNINRISHHIIIEHCFPNNFYIKKGIDKYDKYLYHFGFFYKRK